MKQNLFLTLVLFLVALSCPAQRRPLTKNQEKALRQIHEVRAQLQGDSATATIDPAAVVCQTDGISVDKSAHKDKKKVRGEKPKRRNNFGKVLGKVLAGIGVVGLIGATLFIDIASRGDTNLTGGLLELLSSSDSRGSSSRRAPPPSPSSSSSSSQQAGTSVSHTSQATLTAPKSEPERPKPMRTFLPDIPAQTVSEQAEALKAVKNDFLPRVPHTETTYAFRYGAAGKLACYRRFTLCYVDSINVFYLSEYVNLMGESLQRMKEDVSLVGDTIVYDVAPLMSAGSYMSGYSFMIPPTLAVGDTLPTGTLHQFSLNHKYQKTENIVTFSDFHVAAEEDVSTEAGIFHCLRVEGTMSGFIHNAPLLDQTPYTFWLAPHVGIVQIITPFYNMHYFLHSLRPHPRPGELPTDSI